MKWPMSLHGDDIANVRTTMLIARATCEAFGCCALKIRRPKTCMCSELSQRMLNEGIFAELLRLPNLFSIFIGGP